MRIRDNILQCLKSIRETFSFPNENKKNSIWNMLFFISLILSVSLSTLFQSPNFAEKGVNIVSVVLWILTAILAFVLNYKKALYYITWICGIIMPFLLFSVLMLITGTNYFSSSIFRLIIQSLIILFIGMVSNGILSHKQIRFIGICFVFSALLMSAIVVVTIILPSLKDLTGSTYVYESKNSSAPILVSSAIISLFLIKNKKLKWIPWVYFLYIFLFVFAIKCRAVVIILPFVGFYLAFKLSDNKKIPTITLIALFAAILLIFLIPQLNSLIIQKMLFNNKTNVDEIFSGRFTYIFYSFQNLNILQGTPSYYVDCLPILLLCNFGIFGLILLIPLLIAPIFVSSKYPKSRFHTLIKSFIIMFYFNSLLEGFGIFGPGAKAFMFWLIIGYATPQFLKSLRFSCYVSNKISTKINKISLSTISVALSIFLASIGSLIAFVKPINIAISKNIYDRIENSSAEVEYVYASDITFDESNRTTFCVGQRYTFKYNVLPNNTTDKALHPQAWGVSSDIISFDKGNEITATFHRKANFNIDIYSEKVRSLHSVNLINVIDPSDYCFDDIKIWTSENDVNSTEITIKKGQKLNIYYDTDYIPNPDLIGFECSNYNIVKKIDNSFVGLNPGECFINAYGTNNKSEKKSNMIRVTVSDEEILLPDSIDFSLSGDDYFTDTQYNLVVNYNNNSTDDYDVYLNDNFYGRNSKTISFSNPGSNLIEIRSTSKPSVFKKTSIENVNELKILEFVDGNNWFVISDGPKKIDLNLKYNDGSVRTVYSNDLFYDYDNIHNRADKYKSGIVGNDGLTYFPLNTGTRELSFVANRDHSITTSINIQSSIFTAKERTSRIMNVGFAASTILFVFSSICLFGTARKRKLIMDVAGFVLLLLIPWPYLLLGNHNNFSFVLIVVSNVLVVGVFVLFLFLFKKTKISSFLPDAKDIVLVERKASFFEVTI